MPRTITSVLVVALGEPARLTPEAGRKIWRDLRHQILSKQVVVDLGVGAAVPAGPGVVFGHSQALCATCVVADQVRCEVHEQAPEPVYVKLFNDFGVGVKLPGAVDSDRARVRLDTYGAGEDRAGEVGRSDGCPEPRGR